MITIGTNLNESNRKPELGFAKLGNTIDTMCNATFEIFLLLSYRSLGSKC